MQGSDQDSKLYWWTWFFSRVFHSTCLPTQYPKVLNAISVSMGFGLIAEAGYIGKSKIQSCLWVIPYSYYPCSFFSATKVGSGDGGLVSPTFYFRQVLPASDLTYFLSPL